MRSDHNEGREPIMRDVRNVLTALREGNRDNPEVLAVESHQVMVALNKGFPKHMYHATLDPVLAIDKQDQAGLEELGYSTQYIPREYPQWIYRRNFAPKYALQVDRATGMPRADQLEFIESRLVRDAKHLAQILKEPKPAMPMGVTPPGDWCKTVTDVSPIEINTAEDNMLTIARLEGQLAEARANSEAKGKKN